MATTEPFDPNPKGAGLPFSRRSALGLLAGAGATLGVTGCQVSTSSENTDTDTSKLELPDAKTKLPTKKVKLRWMDNATGAQLFETPLFKAYQKKHENIKIHHDSTNWDHINETIPLAVRNDTAPDVFQIPNKVPDRTAVKEGWVKPIEDLVPDFDSWRKKFPENSLVPGTHVFDGKVYSFPLTNSGTVSQTLIYDVELMKKADIDPEEDISSWDDFRQAAKKLSKKGDNKFYGLMDSRTPIKIIEALASSAGWRGTLDYRTGKYDYTSEPVLDAVELLLSIHRDKSLWPDFAGISAADARARMPNGVAGMIVDGQYSVDAWQKQGWKFKVRKMPTPDGKGDYFDHYTFSSGTNTYVYAKTKLDPVIGDLYHYMGSVEGQKQAAIQSKGALNPVLSKARNDPDVQDALDPTYKSFQQLSEKVMRRRPDPAIRNADTAQVELLRKSSKPSFSDILGGMLTGQVKDVKKSLKKLEEKENTDLDNAIKKARKKGAKVSRDDYVFPNWKADKDYAQDDYDQL